MAQQVFINMMVNDLEQSKEFYSHVGFTNNPQFTDETGACMVLSDTIYVMLLTKQKMKSFTTKTLVDAHQATEVLLAISRESRQAVDEMFDKAIAKGGKEVRKTEDHGFMYLRTFEDLDGHIWEVMWMDQSVVK